MKRFAAPLLLAIGCTSAAPTVRESSHALTVPLVISEVLFNPPGTDGNNEFIELQCTPSLALDSYWFVIIEGDYSTSDVNARGSVWFAKALTGVTCGTNGFVVLQRGSVASGVAGTTYVNAFFPDNLQNGTQTLWLLQTATFSDPNNDIDDDNDGVIDDPTLAANIVDSVAISDGYVDDRTYSPATLTLPPDGPAAISRFAGTSATSPEDWYFGTVKGPSPFTYDTTLVSPNFPAGGTLSVGAANSESPTPLPDLFGADFASTDLATSGTTTDLAASATTADLTTIGDDLKQAGDLAKASPDLTDDTTPTEHPDLQSGTTTPRKQATGCSTTPNAAANLSSLMLLMIALIAIRRRAHNIR